MRTWTLERQWSGNIVVGGHTEKLSIHSPVQVIELEPVLDLLERWFGHRQDEGELGIQKTIDTENLLAAHGRLDG